MRRYKPVTLVPQLPRVECRKSAFLEHPGSIDAARARSRRDPDGLIGGYLDRRHHSRPRSHHHARRSGRRAREGPGSGARCRSGRDQEARREGPVEESEPRAAPEVRRRPQGEGREGPVEESEPRAAPEVRRRPQGEDREGPVEESESRAAPEVRRRPQGEGRERRVEESEPDQRRRFAAARIAKAARDTRPVAPMNPGAAKVRVGPTVNSVPSVKEHVSKKTQPQRVKVQFLPKK